MTTILFYLFIYFLSGCHFFFELQKKFNQSINGVGGKIMFTFILANINAYSMNKNFSEELRHLVSFRSNSDN